MISEYVAIRLAELVVSLGFSLYYLNVFLASKRALWVYAALAGTFLFYGFSDCAEYLAQGQFPWWLWLWKIAGGFILFGLFVTAEYHRRGMAALAPWRFVALLVIVALAIKCRLNW
jgi:hypothetical protein